MPETVYEVHIDVCHWIKDRNVHYELTRPWEDECQLTGMMTLQKQQTWRRHVHYDVSVEGALCREELTYWMLATFLLFLLCWTKIVFKFVRLEHYSHEAKLFYFVRLDHCSHEANVATFFSRRAGSRAHRCSKCTTPIAMIHWQNRWLMHTLELEKLRFVMYVSFVACLVPNCIHGISLKLHTQALSGVTGGDPSSSGGVIGTRSKTSSGGVLGGGPGGVPGAARGGGERLRSGLRSHHTGWSGGGRIQSDLGKRDGYIYIYTYIYICIYMYLYVFICIYIYIHICI